MKKLVALACVLSFFASCAGMTINPGDLKTPHARGHFINKTILMAYQDHQRFSALPNLRPEAKTLLNIKRDILIQLLHPAYGPVTVFNNYIQTGQPITDAMFQGLLDELLLMETGWYTKASAYQDGGSEPMAFRIVPAQNSSEEDVNTALKNTSVEAGVIKKQVDPILVGVLIELLRSGIHAIQALLQQRGLDSEQLAEAYQQSYQAVMALEPRGLIICQ